MRQLALPTVTLAALAALSLPAQAETRSFDLKNFNKVAASAGVDVILKQGPFAVSVEEPDGKFDRLELRVRDSTLVASRKSDFRPLIERPHYTITVSAPDYRALNASSGSHVEGDALRLANFAVEVSSGAHVGLSGDCKDIAISVSSGSHFSGEDLKCERATVSASSGAHADAFATATATGDASSGAHINFHGKPANVTKDTSSGGSVSADS